MRAHYRRRCRCRHRRVECVCLIITTRPAGPRSSPFDAQVTHERGPEYPGGCVETTPGGTLERCNTIALELANHPLVRHNGTALLITHGCPSTHMVKSLCPTPGGIYLPDYADIKVSPRPPACRGTMRQNLGWHGWVLVPESHVLPPSNSPPPLAGVFAAAQAGNYDGPPLQYTATTALK